MNDAFDDVQNAKSRTMVRREFYVIVAAFLALHAVVMTAYFIVKVPADWWPAICKPDECTFAGWFSAFGNWSGAVVAFATYFLLKRQIDVSVMLHRQMIWLQNAEPMALADAVFQVVREISQDVVFAAHFLQSSKDGGVDEASYNRLIALKAGYSSHLFDRFEERFNFRSESYIAEVRALLNDFSSSHFFSKDDLPTASEIQRRLKIIEQYNAVISSVACSYSTGVSSLVR